jgi:hypothetical protein
VGERCRICEFTNCICDWDLGPAVRQVHCVAAGGELPAARLLLVMPGLLRPVAVHVVSVAVVRRVVPLLMVGTVVVIMVVVTMVHRGEDGVGPVVVVVTTIAAVPAVMVVPVLASCRGEKEGEHDALGRHACLPAWSAGGHCPAAGTCAHLRSPGRRGVGRGTSWSGRGGSYNSVTGPLLGQGTVLRAAKCWVYSQQDIGGQL